MNKTKLLLAVLGVIAILACSKRDGDDDDQIQYSNEALSGKIETINWSYRTGRARRDPSDPNRFAVTLYESEPYTDVCNYIPSTNENLILFSVPSAPGNYRLRLDEQTVTFYIGVTRQNKISDRGGIYLRTVSETMLNGSLKADIDMNTYVNGVFTIRICP